MQAQGTVIVPCPGAVLVAVADCLPHSPLLPRSPWVCQGVPVHPLLFSLPVCSQALTWRQALLGGLFCVGFLGKGNRSAPSSLLSSPVTPSLPRLCVFCCDFCIVLVSVSLTQMSSISKLRGSAGAGSKWPPWQRPSLSPVLGRFRLELGVQVGLHDTGAEEGPAGEPRRPHKVSAGRGDPRLWPCPGDLTELLPLCALSSISPVSTPGGICRLLSADDACTEGSPAHSQFSVF